MLYIVPAEKSSISTIYGWRLTESFLVRFQRRFYMSFIRWIAVEYTVLSNKSLAAFCNKDLVAEFDRFQYFASFDQVGVGFKDRKELLVVGNLLAFEHSTTGLINHPFSRPQ